MNDLEKIRSIRPIPFNKYGAISSREKLMAYVLKYMNDNKIRTTYNYICVSAYMLFPEKFRLSDEFKEYPHIEMINRTLMHMWPKQNNYATGSSRIDYELTPFGIEIANQVENEINMESNIMIEKEVVDEHKSGYENDYKRLINNDVYKRYLETNEVIVDMIWDLYEVTPFTQKDRIKKSLQMHMDYCKIVKDEKAYDFCKKLLSYIK